MKTKIDNTANRRSTHTPFGTWESDLSATQVAESAPRLAESMVHNKTVYWLQSIPSEKGRIDIRASKEQHTRSILPQPFSARSKIHEYGGGSFCIGDNCLYFVNADDQQLYRIALPSQLCDLSETSPAEVHQMTSKKALRFGDITWDNKRKKIFAVAESHQNGVDIKNYIASISTSGEINTLVDGADFYAYPRVSHCGEKLCWIQWNHPNMPWDNSELHVGDLNYLGKLENVRQISTIEDKISEQSILQPLWSANGDLFYVSDHNNWWNIYRCSANTLEQASDIPFDGSNIVFESEAEFATPLWTLGMQNYTLLDDDTLLVSYTQNGMWQLGEIHIGSQKLNRLAEYASVSSVASHYGQACFIASTPTRSPRVYTYTTSHQSPKPLNALSEDDHANSKINANISIAECIRFPTTQGACAHAFYYAPKNVRHYDTGPAPLIVLCHGGPTGQTDCGLNPKIQFWTQRGFAVADVNYRGSTGYGRAYRQTLYKNWGISDVDDIIAVVTFLVKRGSVNPNKTVVKGSSSGGFTVLAALAQKNTFKCGVSLYGIGDLSLLVADTHKFESQYLEQLIGPYTTNKNVYRDRSPITHTESIDCPVLLFQGLEDKIVPPNQARAMKEGIAKRNLPVALVEYENEGHGFRQTETIVHMLKSELFFYQRVFKLKDESELGDSPITIENM